MVLAERAIERASMVPEGQRLPFEDSLTGGRGSMCTFLGGWGSSTRCSQAPGQHRKPGADVWDGWVFAAQHGLAPSEHSP